jgi:hypothetical protein
VYSVKNAGFCGKFGTLSFLIAGLLTGGLQTPSAAQTSTLNFYIDDYATISIDGTQVGAYDNEFAAGNVIFTPNLTPGWHTLSIDYANRVGTNCLGLSWLGPGTSSYSVVPKSNFRSLNQSGQYVQGLRADYYSSLGGSFLFTVFGEGPIDNCALSFTSEIYEGVPGLWAGVFGPSAVFEERLSGEIYISACPALDPGLVSLGFNLLHQSQMFAKFVPTIGGTIVSLATALAACGFDGFDWVQTFDQWPGPNENALYAAAHQSVPLAPPFVDPPLGGYTYQVSDPLLPQYQPNFAAANPFYYSPFDIASDGCALASPPSCALHMMSNSSTLNFFDAPADSCLPGGEDASNAAKCNTTPPLPAEPPFMSLTTQLVGYLDCAPLSPECNSQGFKLAGPMFQWQWLSDFNGSTGGIFGAASSNIYAPDPGSGTGGITITAIDGVALPPVVPSSEVATIASGLAYSRVSQTFNGTVTLTNIGASSVSGPLQVVFTGLTSSVTLANATGNLSGTPSPYLTVPAVASLTPGQSVTVSVQFKNPSNAVINFTPVIYSGSID